MAFVITGECISCGKCVDVCQPGAVKEGETRYWIEAGLCGECGDCREVCPIDCIIRPADGESESVRWRLGPARPWKK